MQKAAANEPEKVSATVRHRACNDGQARDPDSPKVVHPNDIYSGQSPAQLGYGPVFIEWEQWSSAASINRSKSAIVHASRGTHVANIARSRLNRANAVMVIRDYSQQLLHAPPSHMAQNLGHPSKNTGSVESISPRHASAKTFKATVRPQAIVCKLFGLRVSGGLGYRERKVELGEYGPNTAWSTLFWPDGKTLSIANHDPNVCLVEQVCAVS